MDETEALRQVNHLIARLEREHQQAISEVDRLSKLLEDEREKNQAEWKQFFNDACLKNTITGVPIQSKEEFQQWKAQFDAAKAERQAIIRSTSTPYSDAAPSSPKERNPLPSRHTFLTNRNIAITARIVIFSLIALSIFLNALEPNSNESFSAPPNTQKTQSQTEQQDAENQSLDQIDPDADLTAVLIHNGDLIIEPYKFVSI